MEERALRIALIQQHATEDVAKNRARGAESLARAAGAGARLVVFPELAFTPFHPQRPAEGDPSHLAETLDGPTVSAFRELAARHELAVVLNLFERSGGRTWDASPVIDSSGEIVMVNRMVHILEAPGMHEQGYYHPGENEALVVDLGFCRLGVAICYDRHFPEYMRALALAGAELVVVPQAGALGEWPEGLFEAELRIASFQNGYFCALCNRVGAEETVTFGGGSFVTAPDGRVIDRAGETGDALLIVDLDLAEIAASDARRHFLPDRRPELYRRWFDGGRP